MENRRMRSLVRIAGITLLVFTTTILAADASGQQPATLQRHHTHPHHRQKHHHHYHQQRQQRKLADNTDPQIEPFIHPNEEIEFVDNSKSKNAVQLNGSTSSSPASTRLRRISARDYYNKVVVQRRTNNPHRNTDWAYNSYNVHTNLFGSPPSSVMAGKGDDNTQDVEFISSGSSSSNNNNAAGADPEWQAPNPNSNSNPRRSFGGYVPPLVPSSTLAPPPTRRAVISAATPPALVPARRGYATAAPPSASDIPHATEDPFDTNTIARNYPSNDAKEMERRHICVQQRTITRPVKTTEVYTRPIWKHISTPCQPQTHANQMCTRVQIVHEQAFRDVIRHKSAQQVTYDCCAGWTRETPHADACMKPICSARCQNGGTCFSTDTCSCPPGFTGRYCEHDVNECKEEKPCDQTCINTVGSYYCKCREGFVLQADQQSCKKIDIQDDDAFEARDLENEIETSEDVAARLQKIERSLANERVQSHELQKSLQATYNVVDTLKGRLSTLEKQQNDLNRLQTNLYATETRTNKLEGMLNLLMKCRNGPNAYCP